MVRVLVCHIRSRGFESHFLRIYILIISYLELKSIKGLLTYLVKLVNTIDLKSVPFIRLWVQVPQWVNYICIYINMLLYSYENKFNTLIQKQNVNTLKKFDTQELDLSYRNKKMSILYSLFLYYLRIIYKLLINIYFVKSKKYRNSKNKIFNYISSQYKKINDKHFFSKKIVLSMLSFFTYVYQSKIVLLSIFLEKNGTMIVIRNLNKLTSLIRTQVSKITTLNVTQLFKLCGIIKKYMWHYNKLILDRVKENKFNFYIKLLAVSTNIKYNQIHTYLSINKLDKNMNFIEWFSTVIEYYMQRSKKILYTHQSKLVDFLARYSFSIIQSDKVKQHNIKKYINFNIDVSYFSSHSI